MKITKLTHSCLLVEMPAPVNRTALFDPGVMSETMVNVDSLEFLDDIIITHSHADHFSADLINQLVQKFPDVRITAPADVVNELEEAGIKAGDQPIDGVVFFESSHEGSPPFLTPPAQNGIHYLDRLTHPGDSHSFAETKEILALPVTAPWGSTVTAVNLALLLKPKTIIPVHDWHWRPEAQAQMYDRLAGMFEGQGIRFIKTVDGEAFTL